MTISSRTAALSRSPIAARVSTDSRSAMACVLVAFGSPVPEASRASSRAISVEKSSNRRPKCCEPGLVVAGLPVADLPLAGCGAHVDDPVPRRSGPTGAGRSLSTIGSTTAPGMAAWDGCPPGRPAWPALGVPAPPFDRGPGAPRPGDGQPGDGCPGPGARRATGPPPPHAGPRMRAGRRVSGEPAGTAGARRSGPGVHRHVPRPRAADRGPRPGGRRPATRRPRLARRTRPRRSALERAAG